VLLIKIAGGLVLAALVVTFLLRGRGGARRSPSRSEKRPALPPSPYQPSRGFRILDGTEPEKLHPVQLPHLDPAKEFVFNDPLAQPNEPVNLLQLRHDERWALDRSTRHAPHPRVRRRRRLAWITTVVIVAIGLIAIIAANIHLHGH